MDSQQVLNDDFIHLHVHSSYSLLEGAITTKKLKELCFQNNMPAVAITDTGNMFAALEILYVALMCGAIYMVIKAFSR